MPQVLAGLTMEPEVSVPMPNATHAAAGCRAWACGRPLELWVRFQGFFVPPRKQFPPCANWPVESLA